MKLVNQYIIPFKGLKEGEHVFDFEIGQAFFDEYPSLEISSGDVKAQAILLKRSSFMELNISMNGLLELQCDRCLEHFDFQLEHIGDLFVKFKEDPDEPDDNVIFLHPNDDHLDLTQFFLDSIGLSIPIQKLHPETLDGESTCDGEMLDKLEEYANKDSSTEDEIDPRWAKLKDLLNERNKNK